MTPALLVVTTDVPLPANSGGRVDVWRRLLALREAGCRLALVCWRDASRVGPGDAAAEAELRRVCEHVHVCTIDHRPLSLLRRLACLPVMPSHAAARWAAAPRTELLQMASRFQPQAVLVDGLYGGALGQWLAFRLGCRLLYRAHNIEYRYMAAQRRLASGIKPHLGLTLNLIGLQRFERRLRSLSDRVFDISEQDLREWAAAGLDNGSWLPTPVPQDVAKALDHAPGARWDVLYFGNLHTPNNVDAVRWLVMEVLPRLPATVRVGIAGSSPSRAVMDCVSRDPRVELVANPPLMEDVVVQARVLVNPVRASSGVNLKSVEMLFSRAALVSTVAGVRGLSPAAAACFSVADDAAGFASAIERHLRAPFLGEGLAALHQREAARRPFTAAHTAQQLLAELVAPSAALSQKVPA